MPPSSPFSMISQVYLMLYNFVQILGWSYIGFKFVNYGIKKGEWDNTTYYEECGQSLKLFQTLAALEILHSAIGIVRSPLMTTIVQIFSRVFVVWGICEFIPGVKTGTIGVPIFIVAWTVTEVIRYSFYFFTLIGYVPYVLKWLRYTLFIGLYPLGVTGELLAVYAGIQQSKKHHLYEFNLPNKANFSFSFVAFLVIFAVSYIPVFPQLYLYMFSQRKKVLGSAAESDLRASTSLDSKKKLR